VAGRIKVTVNRKYGAGAQPYTVTTVVLDTPSSTSINFETFIELADLSDVLRFCDTVASTEGRNLKLLWDCAFEAGLEQGRNEEQDLRDEMYLQGKARGRKDAEEAASRVNIDLYSHGIEKGRTEEQLVWTSKGHGLCCFSPIAVLSDQIIQTDPEQLPSAPCTTNSMIQTDSSSSASVSMQTEPILEPPTPTIVASARILFAEKLEVKNSHEHLQVELDILRLSILFILTSNWRWKTIIVQVGTG
jgi:hypothetical protein